jgi:hypothetical protein
MAHRGEFCRAVTLTSGMVVVADASGAIATNNVALEIFLFMVIYSC